MQATLVSGDSDGPEFNTSRYRIFIPAKYLKKAGHEITLMQNAGSSTTVNGRVVDVPRGIDFSAISETVLIERNVSPDLVDKLRLAGAKRIVVTFDDNYALLPETAAAKPWWKDRYARFLKALGMVDLVIVPSKLLLETHKAYCKQILWVPNFLDNDDWVSPFEKSEKNTIGWGGSAEHVASWKQSQMVKDLARVLEENPDWEFFFAGPVLTRVVDQFPRGTKIVWANWMSYPDWTKKMASLTIGLAPLAGEYDNYRSNLKLVEYAAAGVPWIASWASPYTSMHVRGGVLVKSRDWYSALSLMVKDKQARCTLSRAGKEWSQEYMMANNVAKYEAALWLK